MDRRTFLNKEIQEELATFGIQHTYFVDLSNLPEKQNQHFSSAVLFIIPLTPEYLQIVFEDPDYVRKRVENNFDFADDEYALTEQKADKLSDHLTHYLKLKGHKAYSLSDASLIAAGDYDGLYGGTVLPDKTVAVTAGLGWIGKNNLLTTSQYGSALCMGVVLTDAPLQTISGEILSPQCRSCTICLDICEKSVLKGTLWNAGIKREDMINVYECSTCIKCMVHCPRTRKYMRSKINGR